MPSRAWFRAILAAHFLCGCTLFERTQQCQALQSTMEAFEPRLTPPLPASPSADALRAKGRLYEGLAIELGALPLADDAVRKHRDALIRQLRTLGARLESVAKTMEDAETEQTERDATQARVERRRRQREAKQRLKVDGQEPETDLTKTERSAPLAARPAVVRTPTAATRSAYEKAKIAIEAEGQRVTGTLSELARACD